ncbi:MAG: phytanoyl-CoA dioxygenase family protein [Lautropia sp.]
MGRVLTDLEARRFHEVGYHFPVDIFDPETAASLADRYHREAPAREILQPDPHYKIGWLHELVMHPKILDAVEDLIGPDIFCLGARFFPKPAGSGAYVSWHQDGEYLNLQSPDLVTAWIALTDSTAASGCVRVIPGTHRSRMRHEERGGPDNLLSRGQEVVADFDRSGAVDVALAPGQMSLHHPLLIHGSEPNTSKAPRIGFGIQYIPTRARPRQPLSAPVLLVRGTDEFHNFVHA